MKHIARWPAGKGLFEPFWHSYSTSCTSISLVKIYHRSLSKSRSVLSRISRRNGRDLAAIAVINRLAFFTEFRGAIGALAGHF